jgi:hypothetical protein
MPIPQSYYLNGTSLSTSTAVFIDPLMTICAPDGFYSDGSMVREMIGCVLSPPVSCDSCGLSCETSALGVTTGKGVYNFNTNVGGATGAVVITFMPNTVPDGIIVTYDGVTYNALSSQLDGYHAAPVNLPTYVGETASDCGLVSNSPYVLTEYENSGTLFVPTGNTPTVTVSAPQVSLSASDPLACIMVIPKPFSAPTNLNVQIYGVCDPSLSTVMVSCPQTLTPYFSTGRGNGMGDTCGLETDQTYYSVPVNGNGIELGLYDWVFTTPYATTPLADGFYTAPIHCPPPYDTYEVLNGVINQFTLMCKAVDLEYSVENTTSPCVSGGITSANLLVEWMPLATPIVNVNANTSGITSIQNGVFKVTFTVTYGNPITGCGGIDMRIKLNTVEVASNPYIVPSATGVYQLIYVFSANGLTNYSLEATVSNGTPL